jgi:hypothetical protein
MTRVKDFYQDLQRAELADHEICAGLGNGDIEKPDWLAVSESTDHLIIWDSEEGDKSHWSAIRINY